MNQYGIEHPIVVCPQDQKVYDVLPTGSVVITYDGVWHVETWVKEDEGLTDDNPQVSLYQAMRVAARRADGLPEWRDNPKQGDAVGE